MAARGTGAAASGAGDRFLYSRPPGENATLLAPFHRGLKEAGYVEGENLTVEYRWADDKYDRLPLLAADLVGHRVAVIVANGPAVRPAKAATSTIPIVFVAVFDPLAFGLVASLSRPGGNLTGVSVLDVEIGARRLELLHELIPTATNAALLVGPAAAIDETLSSVFATLVKLRAGGVVIYPDPLFTARNEQLAALAHRYVLPAISAREFAVAGGLMGYGPDVAEAYRLAGAYAWRILKGERPADMPVQQS
jgi:ABC-type uncharacterized transport system substrate-binding protein